MTNRLAHETSPYLRQHRDNPVDWFPWGDEAFALARDRDRPVLLSVGYSACHWCHVMAHESFEHDETAALMNRLFVNIKVDREERPDVDAVYMDAVQALSGHGGWPMTVFLTPEGEPFFGGTYYPLEARQGMPSFRDVCRAVDDHWNNQRDQITEQAVRLVEAVSRAASLTPGDAPPDAGVVPHAVDQLLSQHDPEWGGFGRAPKFPQTMSLNLMLDDLAHGERDAESARALRDAIDTSLLAMASGGIYDHLGGGFARYSVDESWLVPHFEKMLYDQAQLIRTYLRGALLTGSPVLRQVVDETVHYVLRDLGHEAGGFYSAEDADSEGEEGAFYVWRRAEIDEVAGATAAAAVDWYGVTDAGNFEGANILHRPVRGDLTRPEDVETARELLFAARGQRVRPGLDDKVLTEWNALMVSSLAESALATDSTDMLDAARAGAGFLVDNLRDDRGRWLRSWQPGPPGSPGRARHLAYAADHAALIDAFTRLGEASGERRWTDLAATTADALLEHFWDDEHGGCFTTAHDAEHLVARQKDFLDNATPSANSTAALSLLRLAALTGNDGYRRRAESILALFGPLATEHPTAFAHLLQALDLHHRGTVELVIPGDRPDLVAVARARYRPRLVLAWGEAGSGPLWADREDGLAYVCENSTCQLPVDTPEALRRQLDELC